MYFNPVLQLHIGPSGRPELRGSGATAPPPPTPRYLTRPSSSQTGKTTQTCPHFPQFGHSGLLKRNVALTNHSITSLATIPRYNLINCNRFSLFKLVFYMYSIKIHSTCFFTIIDVLYPLIKYIAINLLIMVALFVLKRYFKRH